MRIGRAGIFTTKGGYVGVGAVIALLGSEALIAKDANTGALIKFQRGQFATFDSCGMNPHAADKVRAAVGITVGGRDSISPDQANDAIDFDNYEPTDVLNQGKALVKGGKQSRTVAKTESLTGTEVHMSPLMLAAIRQVVKEVVYKKKPKPVRFIADSSKPKAKARPRASK